MRSNVQLCGTVLIMMALPLTRAAAQASIRDVLIVDSLSPAKTLLRDYVAELRDTLTIVESIHARVVRANASGMSSVVQSAGRQLGKRCRAGIAMSEVTQQRVSVMKTSDARGEKALASFRSGLVTLSDGLKLCDSGDSAVMAGPSPDSKRIQQVAALASDVIAQFNLIRDGLLRLLDITLPVKSYMPPPRS